MQPSETPQRATRHDTFYIDEGDLVVRVEGTLYRFHSFHLLRATTYFDTTIESGDADAQAGIKEGASDDHPLIVEGVKALDFEYLLWFFYESAYKWAGVVDPALTPKWESILLLAAKFDMNQVAKVACFALGRAGALGDVRKIGLAAKLDLGKGWVVEELQRVVARSAPLRTDEGLELGNNLTIAVAALREAQVRGQTRRELGITCPRTFCDDCGGSVRCSNGAHGCRNCHHSFPCPETDPGVAIENMTFPSLSRSEAICDSPDRETRAVLEQDFFVQVESLVLSIHSYHLKRASPVFVDMLNLPAHNASSEGRSRDHPIVLDIKLRQFESLQWFLYESSYEWSYKVDATLSPVWEDILVVADMFNMEEICRVATYALDHTGGLTDIRKVALCVRHGVDKSWAVEALERICVRQHALTKDEAREIGLDMTAAIASAREAAYKVSGGNITIAVGQPALANIVKESISQV